MYNDYLTVETSSHDVDAINQSIKNILLTRKGSLPGKPRFGSDLYKVIFEQMDHILISLTEDYIEEALSYLEQRIIIVKVEVKSIPEYNRLIASITYEFRDDILPEQTYSLNIINN